MGALGKRVRMGESVWPKCIFSFGAAETIRVLPGKKASGLWACKASLRLSIRLADTKGEEIKSKADIKEQPFNGILYPSINFHLP